MSEMKTIKFPGDTEPREIVDAKARERLDDLEKKVGSGSGTGSGSSENVDLSGYVSKEELPEAINTALAQAKVSGEFDGADGEDGYTPVRGTDYWTDADKAEIKAYVDEAILGGAW